MTVIAACQLALAVGDLAGNARAAESAVRDAAARGAQFVVLPELSNTGYVFTGPAEARALAAPAAESPALRQWRCLALLFHRLWRGIGYEQRKPILSWDKAGC